MGKHRRPSRLTRLRSSGSPLHLSIAAGVAGTVAITGTVVASAGDGTSTVRTTLAGDQRGDSRAAAESPAVAHLADLGATGAALQLRDAVHAELAERAERLAEAKARAIAKRKAEQRRAERRKARLAAQQRAEERAEELAERRAAAHQAAHARSVQTVSRSIERTSASASSVLSIAAQVASGAYYAYGGAGPSGFDCSGFTSYVFSKVGISLPHSSSAQRSVARPVSSPQPGDLVFVYNGGGGSIGHVAIYAGGGYWWEASNPSTGVGKHRAWSSAVSYGRVL
jgi:cell wall-associated NlpC family hydrolase